MLRPEQLLNCPYDETYPRCQGCHIQKRANGTIFVRISQEYCVMRKNRPPGVGSKSLHEKYYFGTGLDELPEDVSKKIQQNGSIKIISKH